MNETTVENMTTIGTVYESMMQNQRTYLANEDNKHRLGNKCTDFSLNTSRNGVGEVPKRSRSQSFVVNMEAPDVTENHGDYIVKQTYHHCPSDQHS